MYKPVMRGPPVCQCEGCGTQVEPACPPRLPRRGATGSGRGAAAAAEQGSPHPRKTSPQLASRRSPPLPLVPGRLRSRPVPSSALCVVPALLHFLPLPLERGPSAPQSHRPVEQVPGSSSAPVLCGCRCPGAGTLQSQPARLAGLGALCWAQQRGLAPKALRAR